MQYLKNFHIYNYEILALITRSRVANLRIIQSHFLSLYELNIFSPFYLTVPNELFLSDFPITVQYPIMPLTESAQ